MAITHLDKVREVRIRFPASLSLSYTDLDNAAWNTGTASKLRVTACDDSGLVGNAEPDETLQQDPFANESDHPTTQDGTVKLEAYLGGGTGTTTDPVVGDMLETIFGGLATPAAKTLTPDVSGNTTSNLACTTHGLTEGDVLLMGVRGDARGEGEVRWVKAVTDADNVELNMATQGAVTSADTIVVGHTAYLDDSAQKYMEVAILGEDARDQINAIGCMGPVSFSNLDPSGKASPRISFDLSCCGWRDEPSGSRISALSYATAHDGEDPDTIYLARGGFFFNERNATTAVARKAMRGVNWAVDPGVGFEEIRDANGLNGKNGFRRVPTKCTLEFDVPLEDDDDIITGFTDDFIAKTAYEAVLQMGHEIGKCVAMCFQNLTFDMAASRQAVNALRGVKCKLHANQYVAGADAQQKSRIWIAWF